MQRFRSLKTLQKFSSVHAQVHNQFNQERHLVTRQIYKQRRSATLAEWRHCGVDRHLKEGACPTRRRTAVTLTNAMKTLQKFSSVHTQVHNQFNQERHLVTRQVYKQRRSIALTEWRALAA